MRRNDPDVGAVLTAIEMSLLSVEWYVEGQGETPQDEEAAGFLEQAWDDMSMSPSDLLSDIFTMFPFGFHLAEIVYKQRNGPQQRHRVQPIDAPAPSKYDDGRIGWRKIAPRHQETIERWSFDEGGGLQGAWQILPQGGRVFLPIDKCLLFTTKRERGNPEGYSILRNAWRSYYIKTNVEETEVISAERDMTGLPTLTLPVGATDQDKLAARDVLEKIKIDDQAGLILPRTGEGDHQRWMFELMASPGTPRIDTDKVISRNTIAIARSMLAQFLTLGQGRVGSYALSKDMRDLFHLAANGYLNRIEETLNRFAVDRLFALNDFENLTDTPKLRHGQMGNRQLDVYMTALEKAAMIGMPFTTEDYNQMRKEFELPELPEDFENQDEDVAPTEQPEEGEGQSAPQTTAERWYSNPNY